MKDIVIYGTGSVGRLAFQIVCDINQESKRWNVIGFLDDNEKLHDMELEGLPVFGNTKWLARRPNVGVSIAIGKSSLRKAVANKMTNIGHTAIVSLIHPLAWLGRRVQTGVGVIIYPGVMVDPDVSIGSFAVLNKGCTIGHDTIIGDFCTISPGVNIGGAVTVGQGCEFGLNSCTIQGISVGDLSVVGAGACVTKSIPASQVWGGVPAKDLHKGNGRS